MLLSDHLFIGKSNLAALSGTKAKLISPPERVLAESPPPEPLEPRELLRTSSSASAVLP